MNSHPSNSESQPSFFDRRGRTVMWVVILIALGIYLLPTLMSAGKGDPEHTVAWRTDFAAAAAEADTEGKLLLINFTADWCPPCRMMKQQVWPDADVRRAVEAGYIPLLIDVDEERHRELTQRYSIRSIPTLIVADPEGQMLHRGSTMRAPQMVRFLQTSAHGS